MKKNRIVQCMMLSALCFAGSGIAALLTTNGDFETDLATVPNAGDSSATAPTGWVLDGGSYIPTGELFNVSALGDGSGGSVGVKMPNWNDDGGWGSKIVQDLGQYSASQGVLTTTWSIYIESAEPTYSGRTYFQFNTASDFTGTMYTVDMKTDVGTPGAWSSHVDAYDAAAAGYDGYYVRVVGDWTSLANNLYFGEITVTDTVPEPTTIGLFTISGLSVLLMRRALCN